MGRKKSGIVSIRLNTPTIHGYTLEPAPVNFFYGKNGVGKTSIGRALADPASEITWKDGKPLKVLLFNEEVADHYIRNVNGFPGVYAVSRENAGIQRQIEEKMQQREKMTLDLAAMKEERKRRQEEAEETGRERIRAVWQTTAEFRKKYPETAGEEDPEALMDRLLTCSAHAVSRETMDAAYQLAYGQTCADAERYQPLYAGEFPSCPLMEFPVISRAGTKLAEMYRSAGSFDWAVSGTAHIRDRRCPFCGETLPDGFEERFEECLDTRYHKDMEKLKEFSVRYEETAAKTRAAIVRNLGNSVPSAAYQAKASQLLDRLESNRLLIQKKLDNPRLEISLGETGTMIRELNEITEELNTRIGRMIRAARDLPEARKRCEKVIWESMAACCEANLNMHRTEQQRAESTLRSLELQIGTQEGRIRLLDRDVAALRAAMTDVSETMERINRSLAENDFTGFRFAKREDNTYAIVRGDRPASGLSEGERKFVAFLYFYHTVLGSLRADAQLEDKVIVVDDPATSTDSEVMGVFSVMIREIAHLCKARFWEGTETGECPDSHIHQLFFLTHNKVFFQMVANDSLSDNDCSLFFEVRKNRENESAVIPCLMRSETAGGDFVNRTPVIGDYQEMWQEYKKTEDPRTLLRVSRGILCRYFLDTCHYSGTDLRRYLLEQNRGAFVPEGTNGVESGFTIIAAMVSLMGMNPLEAMDSVYFDLSAVNTDQIRFVFRRIFEVMHQEQHYAYMIRL